MPRGSPRVPVGCHAFSPPRGHYRPPGAGRDNELTCVPRPGRALSISVAPALSRRLRRTVCWMFAIWRSCQHFATSGSIPDAAGSKLEVILGASEQLPSAGRAHRFVARRNDEGQWLSVGFVAGGALVETTTSAQLRKYERVRAGDLTWSNDNYRPLSDGDHPSRTINLDRA